VNQKVGFSEKSFSPLYKMLEILSTIFCQILPLLPLEPVLLSKPGMKLETKEQNTHSRHSI
jgi:hypothetical protein